jgi:hypothetical protein
LFRPTGGWQVDIHDVALGWAQTRRPGLDWRAAEQALAAAGQFSKSGLMGVDSIPRGLYRLFVLSRSDSGRFHSQTERMRVQAPESFEAVTELLAGYQEALAWYRAVMRFLLVERWFGDPDPRSVLDLGSRSVPRAPRSTDRSTESDCCSLAGSAWERGIATGPRADKWTGWRRPRTGTRSLAV